MLAEPRWWEAAGDSVGPALRRVCGERGLGLDVIVAAEEGLPEALRRTPPDLLVAGPTAAASAAALASALPQTLVLAPGPVPAMQPQNLAALRYDPREAFAEAGRRAAGAGPDCLVGVLGLPDSAAAAAFRAGFLAAGAAARLRERTVAATADRTQLRRAVDEMHASGVRLFLVALRSLTPQCLELLEGRDSLAVVEAQEASGAFAGVVLATVEPDWGAAVRAALDPGAAARASGVIQLPGRLVLSGRATSATWPCGASRDSGQRARS